MADAEQLLKNLLTIIHRDGGQHTDDHGLERSVEDAAQKLTHMRALLDDRVPRMVLIRQAEEMLESILLRPEMYGVGWHAVEVAILNALGERELARAWPEAPPQYLSIRWARACSLTHRRSNSAFAAVLADDGVTDRYVIRAKFETAVRKFLENDGLYPDLLAHRVCRGCKKHGFGQEHTDHCDHECLQWPCDHADGKKAASYWKAMFSRPPLEER